MKINFIRYEHFAMDIIMCIDQQTDNFVVTIF